MQGLILKLLLHALSATVTLLTPQKTASHAGQPSPHPHGAVNTKPQGKPKIMATSPSCEWSIVVDDPITGEPRGLILTSKPLSETQAIAQARAILTTFRLLGTYIKPASKEPSDTTGLYLLSYRLDGILKLVAIWAHCSEDAINTLNRMARCGNLLCYCEPE